jgi:hypothetical protein
MYPSLCNELEGKYSKILSPQSCVQQRCWEHQDSNHFFDFTIETSIIVILPVLESRKDAYQKYAARSRRGSDNGMVLEVDPMCGYRDEMKSRLKLMMVKEHEDTAYALFPKNIRYVRKSDGAKLSTTGITLRIAKRLGISEQAFCEELAERWSSFSIKSGG